MLATRRTCRIDAMESQRSADLEVFISGRKSTCDACHENLGTKAWITLVGEGKARCLDCADLAHLVFLPSGDAALTRRARKHSTLTAVVLKWSRARKRYERRGLLVEEPALARAEAECLSDAEARELRREREAQRRAELDREYVARFAERVRALYPHAPKGREFTIAEHACCKYSDRIGRTASAKTFDADAVALAVTAHVRHCETDYDRQLASGRERGDARADVSGTVREILQRWRG
jgi:hypothetical protein